MRNGRQYQGLAKQSHSTIRFDDSEYERWSQGIAVAPSLKTQWGIERFLGANENIKPAHEDVSTSFVPYRRKMKKGVTIMLWNPHEWKRAAGQLHNRWRSWVEGLSSAVAEEETRIARMELDGQLESIPVSPR